MNLAAAVFALILPIVAWAQTTDDSLSLAEAERQLFAAPAYQATEQDVRAIELDFESRDIVLEPVLVLSGKRIVDHREGYTPLGKTESQLLSATLHKPFSTGTDVSVSPFLERAFLPALTPNREHDFDWQVLITQNLWQDGFGRSTRLRWRREESEKRQRLAGALLRRAQLAIDFETLYWDWAFALREIELRAKNYKRSQEIFSWVQGRFKRAAAESTDLLQARALMTNRELQVAVAKENLIQAQARVQRFVPGAQWRPRLKDLAIERRPEDLVTDWRAENLAQPQRLELLAAQGEAQAAAVRADEARESIRPQLALQMAYGKNGIDPTSGTAVKQSFNENHEYTSVGLVLSTGLDLSREYKQVESARALKASAEGRRVSLESEGKAAWPTLLEQIRDLRARIVTANSLVDIQLKKNDAEKQRYRTGRTTAFEAITFEQDAADAEISLWTLYTLLRKAEAQARLFAR